MKQEGNELLKVLYVPSLNIPVVFWRIENYANMMLRLKNVRVNVEYFRGIIQLNQAWDDACVGKGKISREIQTKLNNAFKFFDVIIFQRIQNMPALALIEEYRSKYPKVKVVAELDDSLGEVSPSSPYKWTDEHKWSAEHLHRSDAVICSTKYLAESIKVVTKDKPVYVAPNCINTKTWRINRQKKKSYGIRVGYVGGGAHDEDLLIAYMAMMPILRKDPSVKFVIRYGGFIPDYFKHNDQVDYKGVAWSMDEYPQQLYNLDLDIALAPLRDSEFNRCKSNIKWLEWASIGVPVIASNTEAYNSMRPGSDVVLVDNNIKFWTMAISDKIEKVKKDGYVYSKKDLVKQCLRNYNLKQETEKLLGFLKSLL
jgi:glycosyltransferase involved in cell wall biosynthesis